MDLFREINSLMVKYGFSPSRKLAQNLVVNEGLLEKMVKAANIEKDDTVLEVGPGTGFLTRELLKHSKVVAVELDSTLCTVLKDMFAKEISEKNLLLVEGNFLDVLLPKFTRVVSLPPYTISSPLLFRLLESDFERAVLVFQKEFVLKCLSSPGFKEFCPIAAMLGYYFDSKILVENIAPQSFFPAPKTFSSLILLQRKKGVLRIKNEAVFKLFLKNVFRYKNKNLSNAILMSHSFFKKELGLSKKDFEKTVLGLKAGGKKVYLIEPQEFVKIFEKLF